MPGNQFDPNPGADPNTQQPGLTGVDMPADTNMPTGMPGQNPMSVSDFATQMFKNDYAGVHKKYEAEKGIIRAALAPNENAIHDELAAEISELKELYKAKHEAMIAGETDQEQYNKKFAAMKMSYRADEFSIRNRYDKQLRQENRTYDQQIATLDKQREASLAEVDMKNTYHIGQMHAYDELVQKQLLSAGDAERLKYKLYGVDLPKPEEERTDIRILSEKNDIKQQLSNYREDPGRPEGKVPFLGHTGWNADIVPPGVSRKVKLDTGGYEYVPLSEEEKPIFEGLKARQNQLDSELVDWYVQQGLLSTEQGRAKQQVGAKGLRASKTKTTNMESNVKRGPSQTVAQKANEPRTLTDTRAKEFFALAKGDPALARKMAQAWLSGAGAK